MSKISQAIALYAYSLYSLLLERIMEALDVIGHIYQYIRDALWAFFGHYPSQNHREIWSRSYEVGYQSISTIMLTNLSIGMVSSLQLTKHFVAFGAGHDIGGVHATTLIRELAPLISGVVLIGRIGSAWAAEIGSMKMTEQLSALQVMRISPQWFLVTPRVIACIMTMPILTTFAIIAGLGGGYFIANIISPLKWATFLDSIHNYVKVYDCMVCLIKSWIFGGIIAAIACIYGERARGGTIGIGLYTTKSVVAGLVALFAMNYILSFIAYNILK